jgi:acyl carrier protein
MDAQDLKEMVAEILEIDSGDLQESSELESFNAYDSVARLSLMVGLSDFTGRPVTGPELMELRTFADVMKLARSGSSNGEGSSGVNSRPFSSPNPIETTYSMSALLLLNSIFQEVFDDPQLTVTPATSSDDLAEWDSVAQVKLVLAIEEAFAVRFTSDDVSNIHSVGDFMTVLARQKGSVA